MLETSTIEKWLKDNKRSLSWLAMQAKVHPVYLWRVLRGKGKMGQATSDKLEKFIKKI